MRFRDYLESDIDDVFLNEDEFAEGHDLNGTVAKAVIQSPTARGDSCRMALTYQMTDCTGCLYLCIAN